MTQEAFPTEHDYIIVKNTVLSYIDFIKNLKIARDANIDNEILLDILNLFATVKVGNEIVDSLNEWIANLENNVERNIK